MIQYEACCLNKKIYYTSQTKFCCMNEWVRLYVVTVTGFSCRLNLEKKLSISESKLSKNHMALAKEIEQVVQHALRLGAKEGAQRMTLLCDQYHKLSPDAAYHLIDPGAFQREVEEAQSRKVEIWHIIRNCI